MHKTAPRYQSDNVLYYAGNTLNAMVLKRCIPITPRKMDEISVVATLKGNAVWSEDETRVHSQCRMDALSLEGDKHENSSTEFLCATLSQPLVLIRTNTIQNLRPA